ncbi:DUF2958 domain-containing protein [Catellatospora citrea]|uniref:Uncharacterized protein n=1 Tax=Catellatospora citrea TaxID=53366 RepID=A0A8J3KP09_9ACTN|nr:DUF2958 domain-containing protein [Catellatospora citrea]GIF98769.1 hypothetical protein Cci01nite_38630 [Catellatospora citrea]
MREILSLYRGHDFLPTTMQLATIPTIPVGGGVPDAGKIVHLHYTAVFGQWWITELEQNVMIAFGFTRLATGTDLRWGYIPLEELEAAMDPEGNIVDRDLRWQPTPAADILAAPSTARRP